MCYILISGARETQQAFTCSHNATQDSVCTFLHRPACLRAEWLTTFSKWRDCYIIFLHQKQILLLTLVTNLLFVRLKSVSSNTIEWAPKELTEILKYPPKFLPRSCLWRGLLLMKGCPGISGRVSLLAAEKEITSYRQISSWSRNTSCTLICNV